MGAEWSVQREALGVKRSGHWSPETTSWCWQVLLNALISRQKCAADILVLRTQFYLYCWPDEHPLNLLVRLTVIFNIM